MRVRAGDLHEGQSGLCLGHHQVGREGGPVSMMVPAKVQKMSKIWKTRRLILKVVLIFRFFKRSVVESC